VRNVETCASSSNAMVACRPKYRMVALDLDGTLLGPDHLISEASVDYLRSLHKKGFIVSIATGRSYIFWWFGHNTDRQQRQQMLFIA